MLREGCSVAQGLLAESSGSDVPRDRGQGSLSLQGLLLEVLEYSRPGTLSVLSPPTIAQSGFCSHSSSPYSPSKCCKVSGAEVQEIRTAAASWEVSWKQQQAASTLLPPHNHYISMREEDRVNAAGINKPACFSFQSKDKGGVCSARRYSQGLQGRQETCGHFRILVWTSSLQMECVGEYFMERSTDKNWKCRRKILGSALHLSGNTAPLERKRSGRKGQSRKQNPVL